MATKTLELEILNVGSPVFTKTPRGGYHSLELAYKNHSFDSKVEGKKLVDFNDKAVFAFIKELKMGDKITVTAEKGDNDQYWKWVAVESSDGSVGASGAGVSQSSGETTTSESSQAAPARTSSGNGRVTGNNYETADERARKQVYIVRQSSIDYAIQYVRATTPVGPENQDFSVQDVLDVAKQFEAYVLEKPEIPF